MEEIWVPPYWPFLTRLLINQPVAPKWEDLPTSAISKIFGESRGREEFPPDQFWHRFWCTAKTPLAAHGFSVATSGTWILCTWTVHLRLRPFNKQQFPIIYSLQALGCSKVLWWNVSTHLPDWSWLKLYQLTCPLWNGPSNIRLGHSLPFLSLFGVAQMSHYHQNHRLPRSSPSFPAWANEPRLSPKSSVSWVFGEKSGVCLKIPYPLICLFVRDDHLLAWESFGNGSGVVGNIQPRIEGM